MYNQIAGRRRTILVIGLVVVFVIGAAGAFLLFSERLSLAQSPIVQRLIPLYRSLRKLPDVLFVPFYALHQTTLPVFSLVINPSNIELMNTALPENPFGTDILSDDSKLWVSGAFSAGDYQDNVRVRYRGNLNNHWNSFKKSYLIKFPSDHLFLGMREMVLVIPSDRIFFVATLNDERAERLGLIVPKESYARLRLNGADHGVYLAFEHWTQEWVEKEPISSLSTIYGVQDVANISQASSSDLSIYAHEGLPYWRTWNSDATTFPEIEAMTDIIDYATDEEFKRLIPLIVNMKEIYALDVLSLLAGSYHSTGDGPGLNNSIFLFDRAEGLFRPVPYNMGVNMENGVLAPEGSLLLRRIWSIPEFKKARDDMLLQYVKEHAKDDEAYLEMWNKTIEPEFLIDFAKAMSNIGFLKIVWSSEAITRERLQNPQALLDTPVPTLANVAVPRPQLWTFPEEFRYLISASLTREQFLAAHPEFFAYGNGVAISGAHMFNATVIIPSDVSLTVLPGASLYFAPDVSLVAYSSIHAEGTASSPIRVRPLDPVKGFGVFALINGNGETNVFRYFDIQGGSEATINGAYISGMLAVHHASVTVSHSHFQGTHGDDGINVKGGTALIEDSVFEDNASDAIDFDYVASDSHVMHNTFRNNHGDSIDLSWSTLVISDNVVESCGDKGVSVGERSNPTIERNVIRHCDYGVAIKDQSHAVIKDTILGNNRIGVALYQKKPFFGGGTGEGKNITFENNGLNISADAVSVWKGDKE